jgi:hypothetical protein
MLIGCQPGNADDVVLLTGANVSVEGNIVTVSNEGMPTLLQQFDSSREAQHWASQVKAAAETWDDVFSLAEVALKRKQALLCKSSCSVGDTGGTGTDGELSQAIADQRDEYSVDKILAASLKKECEINQVCPVPKRWTELNIRVTGEPSSMDSGIASTRYRQKSPLRWLLSFLCQPYGLCA